MVRVSTIPAKGVCGSGERYDIRAMCDEVVIDIDMVVVWYMPKTGDIRRARDEEMGVNIVAVV